MEFHVYETGETVKAVERPVVVITSNNDKELPDAFLRRLGQVLEHELVGLLDQPDEPRLAARLARYRALGLA